MDSCCWHFMEHLRPRMRENKGSGSRKLFARVLRRFGSFDAAKHGETKMMSQSDVAAAAAAAS